MFIAGVAIAGLGLFGLLGSVCRTKCLGRLFLLIYIIVSSILIVVEIVASIFAYLYAEKGRQYSVVVSVCFPILAVGMANYHAC